MSQKKKSFLGPTAEEMGKPRLSQVGKVGSKGAGKEKLDLSTMKRTISLKDTKLENNRLSLVHGPRSHGRKSAATLELKRASSSKGDAEDAKLTRSESKETEETSLNLCARIQQTYEDFFYLFVWLAWVIIGSGFYAQQVHH